MRTDEIREPWWPRTLRPIGLAIILILLFVAFATCVPAPVYADGTVSTQDVGPVAPLCPFSKGWNLVTVRGTPADLPACVATAWGWDSQQQRWQFWGRANAAYWNDLEFFTFGNGYWLYAR